MKREFLKKHTGTLAVLLVSALALALLGRHRFFAATRKTAVPVSVDAGVPAETEEAETEKDADPMAAFALERSQLRGMQTAQLNELIYSADADEATRALAEKQLLDLYAWQEQESTVEGILRMRGYAGAICTVHEDSVNVLLRADSVNRQECAVIYDLVLRETGVTGGNVKIIPVP